MRYHTHHPLYEHQLAPVMHLMFFDGKDHFESAFCCRSHPCGHLNPLTQEIFRQSFEPSSPFLARAMKHLERLILAPRYLFFGGQALHQRGKIESLKRRPVLLTVNLVLKSVGLRDVRQQFPESAGVRHWSETI